MPTKFQKSRKEYTNRIDVALDTSRRQEPRYEP